MKTERTVVIKKPVWLRSYKNYDKNGFIRRLLLSDWGEFTYEKGPDQLWQLMVGIIEEALTHTAPIRKCFVQVDSPPWMNAQIRDQMRQRDQLYRHAKNTKSVDDWRIADNQKNRVGYLLYYSKQNTVLGMLERYKDDPSKFWDGIRMVFPKDCDSNKMMLTDDENDTPVPDDKCAEFINKFFTGIGEKLANKLNVPLPVIDNSDQLHEGHDILYDLFTVDEVAKVVKDIKIKKASSIKDVKTHVLKDAFNVLLDKMVILFNSSIVRQVFPNAWKTGTIIPIPKKGR